MAPTRVSHTMSAPPPRRLDEASALAVAGTESARNNLIKVLENSGFARVRACEPDSVVTSLQDEPAHLVIAYWREGHEDGLSVLTTILNHRDQRIAAHPVFLAMDEEPLQSIAQRRARAENAGASGFLNLPLQENEVIRVVGSALARPRAFITSNGYRGPDRRLVDAPAGVGPRRRADDVAPDDLTAEEEAALTEWSNSSLNALLKRFNALQSLDHDALDQLATQIADASGAATARGDAVLADALEALSEQVRSVLTGAYLDPQVSRVYVEAMRALMLRPDASTQQRRDIVSGLNAINRRRLPR